MRDRTVTGERLRLGAGFSNDEREGIVARLSVLDRRLSSFRAEGIDLVLSVKERGTPSQRVVLECRIPGWPRTVATSTRPGLEDAVVEVRDDLVALLNGLKTRTEPRNNRARRVT